MRIRLTAPAGFNFRLTVHGHGWWTLEPFLTEEGVDRLETVVDLGAAGVRELSLAPCKGGVTLASPGNPGARARQGLERVARRMLGLDLDLTGFYRITAAHEEWEWISRIGAGRLLRSPTIFEDLLKLVLTTNCSWACTTLMVTRLIHLCGRRTKSGARAFPTPARVASIDETTLRQDVRLGYRAPLVVELARRISEGEVDPGSWERGTRSPADLKREMLALPGVGPYVAENLLRLMGRPDGLGLDSFLRSKYARVYHQGRRVTDRTIARRYARFKDWAGQAVWCDLTRDWFDEEGRRLQLVLGDF
jgi:3-methyladenine DNA glycosylase/8-oxoguanine DNA glycosylase